MEILKGKVQDPGFEDVECMYLKADDGSVYIFVQDGQLPNGNVIATPVLKEGIGHAPHTSLGLITSTGQILIPFENKNIQPLKNNLLLVERNVPQTPSVVEASSKQSDPLSAATFIDNANTIKEQLKGVIGINGNYLFDNQFSEAALYTQDGANVGGGYFSYIFETSDDSYYMCSNVVGESIIKYDAVAVDEQNNIANTSEEQQSNPIPDGGVVDNNVTDQAVNQEAPMDSANESTDGGNNIEVPILNESFSNASIPDIDTSTPNINNSVENAETSMSVEQPVQENSDSQEQSVDVNIPAINQVDDDNVVSDEGEGNLAIEQSSEESNAESEVYQQPADQEVTDDVSTELKLNIDEDISDSEDDASLEEDGTEESSVNEDDADSSDVYSDSESDTEEIENDEEEIEEEDVSLEEDNIQEEDSSEEENDMQEEDVSEDENDMHDDYLDDEDSNPIILDATNTIRKLLEENRKQRQVIDQQESEIAALNSSNEIYKEENQSMTEEASSLRNSIKKYRSENATLARDNTRLQSTVSRQEEIIEHLKTQNTTLKEQVAGIQALGHAVAEANTIITSSNDEVDVETTDNHSDFGYLGEDDGFQYTKKAA